MRAMGKRSERNQNKLLDVTGSDDLVEESGLFSHKEGLMLSLVISTHLWPLLLKGAFCFSVKLLGI